MVFKKGHPAYGGFQTRFKKGHKSSDETINKISLKLKGKKYGKQTEEHRRKIVEARRINGTYYTGINHPMYGKHLSEETKKKISLKNKGQVSPNKGKTFSEETRKKISESRKILYLNGIIIPWNKGKTLSEELKKRISNTEKGKKTWNKGIPWDNDTKNKIGLANTGKKHSKEHIDKFKEWRKKFIFPVKDTSIEVKIQNFLKEFKIEFLTHQYMHIEHGYQCDILIPLMNLVIECDGDYWHGALSDK